jgi:hypothetical protein
VVTVKVVNTHREKLNNHVDYFHGTSASCSMDLPAMWIRYIRMSFCTAGILLARLPLSKYP